jgi:hypothetical protein
VQNQGRTESLWTGLMRQMAFGWVRLLGFEHGGGWRCIVFPILQEVFSSAGPSYSSKRPFQDICSFLLRRTCERCERVPHLLESRVTMAIADLVSWFQDTSKKAVELDESCHGAFWWLVLLLQANIDCDISRKRCSRTW